MKNVSIRKNYPELSANLFFIMLVLSLSTTLFTIGFSQKIFYTLGYVSFFIVCYAYFKRRELFAVVTPVFPLILALLITGVIRYCWFVYSKSDTSNFSEYDLNNLRNYDLSGKRFILSAFMIGAALVLSKFITAKTITICKVILFVAIVITAGVGCYEYFYVTHERIKLTADAASSSSYMILMAYASYLALSRQTSQALEHLFDLFYAAIIFALLILCETRISVLAFIVVTVLYLLMNSDLKRYVKGRTIIIASFVLALFIIGVTNQRWAEGIKNIEDYQTNSSTSLGARVAIWDSGIHFASHHFLFSTPYQRTTFAQSYIKEHHPGNLEGYTNVRYNMHNEFLEILTLQGVLGLLFFALIYLSYLRVAITKRVFASAALPLSVMFVCGLADSVLINAQTAMLFLISLTLCAISFNKQR